MQNRMSVADFSNDNGDFHFFAFFFISFYFARNNLKNNKINFYCIVTKKK